MDRSAVDGRRSSERRLGSDIVREMGESRSMSGPGESARPGGNGISIGAEQGKTV